MKKRKGTQSVHSTIGHYMKEIFEEGTPMEKKKYEKPTAVVVEFDLEDAIASSLDFGPDTICSEGFWGDDS